MPPLQHRRRDTTETVISDRTWNSGQSWHRKLVVCAGSRRHRLQFYVCRNAYEEQSCATVDVWANGAWSEVHRIPGVDLLCKSVSYTTRGVGASVFDADIAELRRVAIAVLGDGEAP